MIPEEINEKIRIGREARRAGRPEESRAFYGEAVALLRSVKEPLLLAHAVRHLGDVCRELGDEAAAEPCFVEALQIYRGNRETGRLDLANAIRSMALFRRDAALWAEARAIYSELGIDAGVQECSARIEELRGSTAGD